MSKEASFPPSSEIPKSHRILSNLFQAYASLTSPECPLWTWVGSELYLPKTWFTPEMADWRQSVGLPTARQFATKIELGWQMIQRAQAESFPFEAVACDDLYGHSVCFRERLAAAGITYMANILHTNQVYLKKPVLGTPTCQPGQPGPAPQRLRVRKGVKATTVQRAAQPIPCPPAKALTCVTEHLVNRTRSRANRLKRQQQPESLFKPPP